ncbi:DUF4230 domain-containing protein [Bacillus marasmi]|uniref:DUF4230 domain-containing protein n=1 Tax=Bacillus marasmi TaxID=1926279 RepID=UPI0011CBB309|nr:DUF4230 domain-containing protein [Bacillus marasmi]
MGKQEDLTRQLESIMNELKEAEKESAASVVLRNHVSSTVLSQSLIKLLINMWGKRIIIASIVIVLIAAVGFWYLSDGNTKIEKTSFVEQVQELATLATAKAHIKVVIEQEDNRFFGKEISMNFPGTKRELILIVPATVLAGVDLKDITSNQVKVDEETKQLEIILPHAKLIQEPAIEMDKVIVFSDEGLFRSEVDWSEGFDLASVAQKEIKAEATNIGLLQTAEKSAEKVLTEFFANLGYTVKVTYE